MKAGGLAALLAQTIVAGDVDACCGALRRIFSETLLNDRDTAATATLTGAASRGHDRVVNYARYAHHQRAQAHSFANSAAHAVLCTSFVAPPAARASMPPTPAQDAPTASASPPTPPTTAAAAADTPIVERVWALTRGSLAAGTTRVPPASLYVLCHAAQRTGYWEEALHFCEHLPHPPDPLFLSSLLRPANVAPVLRRCAARGWALNVTNAIRVLAEEHGCWAAALEVARDAEQRLPCGEVYSLGVLVPYLAASGATAEARRLFESGLAQGALTDPVLVQQLLMQTASLRQWAMCLHMLQCLYRTQETAQLLPTDADFFRQLMEVSPGWTTSLQLLHIARASDVKPDERTLAILLTQCDRAGAWREAAAVYDMAVKEDFVDRLALGSTYHTLVRSFSAMQQWQKALEALSWMTKASDASLTAGMTELVTLCEQAGQWEAALAVGASLMDSGVHLFSTETSMALLFACAKGAQWAFAVRLFDAQLHDVRVTPHPLSLCAAMQACVAARQWAAALELYETAKASQPRTVVPPLAHRIAVKACVSGGNWAAVIAVLETMRRDGLPLDNYSQRLGLRAAALQGQWELSLAFLQGIPRHHRTPQDRMLVRNVTRSISPAVDAIALRFLQSH